MHSVQNWTLTRRMRTLNLLFTGSLSTNILSSCIQYKTEHLPVVWEHSTSCSQDRSKIENSLYFQKHTWWYTAECTYNNNLYNTLTVLLVNTTLTALVDLFLTARSTVTSLGRNSVIKVIRFCTLSSIWLSTLVWMFCTVSAASLAYSVSKSHQILHITF